MTTIFLLYVFQILCVLSNNTWRSELLYIQATPLSLQWMKNFSLDCKAAILSRRKAINKHVRLLCMQIFDGAVVLWMLNLGTNRVCQHSLNIFIQYRMCILRTRRCACPIVQVPYAYLRRLPCLLSFPCLHT